MAPCADLHVPKLSLSPTVNRNETRIAYGTNEGPITFLLLKHTVGSISLEGACRARAGSALAAAYKADVQLVPKNQSFLPSGIQCVNYYEH